MKFRVAGLSLVMFWVLLFSASAYAGVLYVKKGGTGNGTSWVDAFGDPQEAIELAAVDDRYSQVWVAAGIYTSHPVVQGPSRLFSYTARSQVRAWEQGAFR